MARKQKILELSTGNLTRIQQETKLKAQMLAKDGFQELPLKAPSWLTGYAKKEYERIAPDMKKLPIRDLDIATVCIYCTWYSAYRECLNMLKKEKDPSLRMEIYSTYLNRITINIKGLTSDLGLTVNSRMQMNTKLLNNEENQPKSMKDMFG